MSEYVSPTQKVGLEPGSLVYTGVELTKNVEIRLYSFSEQGLQDRPLTLSDFPLPLNAGGMYWLSIQGLQDVKLIEEIGKNFSIDSLILEDIVNVHQRPKFEERSDSAHVVLKEITYDGPKESLEFSQVCLLIKNNYVISFKEGHSQIFSKLIERLRTPKNKNKRQSVEKLFHLLLDCVIDHYFLAISALEDRLFQIESGLERKPNKKIFYSKSRQKIFQQLFNIHDIRKELNQILRHITPLRELILNLIQSEYFEEDLRPYLSDVRDHIFQINDSIKALTDQANSMMEMTLSLSSFKLNDIIRTLTVFTAFFMPMTFLTSVYGMNFKYMPFLDHPYGLAILSIIMLIILIVLVIFVRRKNWIE